MAECIADVDCSLEMAKDRLLAEMAKGITPTNQLNGPQNRAEFHAGMYNPVENIAVNASYEHTSFSTDADSDVKAGT